MAWLNADGQLVQFSHEEGVTRKGGHYIAPGPLTGETEFKFDYTDVGATPAIAGGADFQGIIIPRNVRIEEVEIVVETAFTSGGAATLDIGLKRLDRSTELDHNGLVAALALTALDAAGEKTVLRVGSTGAGALIGTTTANAGILVLNYGTAAYTAGKGIVRIRYYQPTTIG